MIWPFVATVVLMLLLGDATLHVIRGVRAYVSAESLWSNAQKNAVGYLEQYAQTHNEDYFAQYQSAIAVTLGDRKARLALDHPRPDLARAREGLRDGRNHPDDVASMIDVFLRFRRVGFMARAVDLWVQGDALVAELDVAAHDLQKAIVAGVRDPGDLSPHLTRIRMLDRELTGLSRAFAATFEDASRSIELILTSINAGTALLLLGVAVWRTRRLLRQGMGVERALRLSEERYEHAVSGTDDGIWDWSLAHPSLYFSPRFEALLGHDAGTLYRTPASFLRLVHADDRRRTLGEFRRHLRTGEALDLELRLRMQDRTYRWFRTRGRSFLGPDGRPVRMAGFLADISERKHAEAQLFEQTERAQVTLASIADAVITVSVAGTVEFLNPVAERLTGWPNADALGVPITTVFSVHDETTGRTLARSDRTCAARRLSHQVRRQRYAAPARRPLGGDRLQRRAHTRQGRCHGRRGAGVPRHEPRAPVREPPRSSREPRRADRPAQPPRVRAPRERRAGRARATRARSTPCSISTSTSSSSSTTPAVMPPGDELLRQVSALLRPRLREGDTLARLGGDEFGVLLEHCAPAAALRIAEALRKTIGDFHFVWKQRPFKVGVSIGLVLSRDGTRTLAQVLSAADAACYMAKDKGRNRVQVWSSESDELLAAPRRDGMGQPAACSARAEPLLPLCAAGERDPQRRRSGRRIPSSCCDCRTRTGYIVPPMSFIPAAERYHLMPASIAG